MKVYVVTSAKPLCEEQYKTVKDSFKNAEKVIRSEFPNAKKDDTFGGVTSFTCKDKSGNLSLMFIHEETL